MQSAIVDRARSLVGVSFRPQGRLEASGLDCVGVVLIACAIPRSEVRCDYRLRGQHVVEMMSVLQRYFEPVPAHSRTAGDVLLLQVAAEQLHLAVHCGASFTHADAAIGRVVEAPGEPVWPLLQTYRLHSFRHES